MCRIYLIENGAVMGINGGLVEIRHNEGGIDKIPKEQIEGIAIYGKSSMTPSCIQFCLEKDVPVSFFTQSGRYYGMLSSALARNTYRGKKQITVFDDDVFSLELSKRVIHTKIHNELVVAKRYIRKREDVDLFGESLFCIRNSKRMIDSAINKNQIRGYEGISAKRYFDVICNILDDSWRFCGRRKRPASDPFNVMLNIGYSLLYKEIIGIIEHVGLNAYVGFMHEDRRGHASLVSDMIEEWRAPIVDATILSMISHNEIKVDMFDYCENGFCRMHPLGLKKLVSKIEQKMNADFNYLEYINKDITFRKAVWHQAERLVKAIEHEDVNAYVPVKVR